MARPEAPRPEKGPKAEESRQNLAWRPPRPNELSVILARPALRRKRHPSREIARGPVVRTQLSFAPIRPLAATHRDRPAAAARAKAAHPSRRALRRGPHPSLPAARRDRPAAMAKAVRPSKALQGRAQSQPLMVSEPGALLR